MRSRDGHSLRIRPNHMRLELDGAAVCARVFRLTEVGFALQFETALQHWTSIRRHLSSRRYTAGIPNAWPRDVMLTIMRPFLRW